MKKNSSKAALVIIAVLAIIPLIIMAGSTGKIAGTITDKATGDPLPGVSVQIVGTSQGAVTDFDGKFTIHLVPPGEYILKISCMGYGTVEVTGVKVATDLTTEQNIEMEKSVADLSHVIKVTADREIIDRFEVSSKVKITKDVIKAMPVTKVDQLLKQTAGVVTNTQGEVIIRGGRAGEVAYIVDGVNIGDPLGGHGPMNLGLSLTTGAIVDESLLDSEFDVCGEETYSSAGGKGRIIGIPKPLSEPTCITNPPPPAHGGTAIVNGEAFDAMFFKDYGTNPFVDTEDDHLSTFAIDIDDGSYVMTRSYLERGHLPPDEAVRVEEFVNHFEYNYKKPRRGPFNVNAEGGPSIFGTNCQLLKIGIQGMVVDPEDRKPANLVFVVDVSGSMSREDRLELVKKSLKELVKHLDNEDEVGIVVYGNRGRVVLEPTSIRYEKEILRAIGKLRTDGATNAEEGLRLGYEMAENNFDSRKINRIILCSDGVANVGTTSPDDILKWIKEFAQKGITLTTVGFGMGNYNDVLMEKLGNKGNGMYAYVDDFEEAKRCFLENLTGMLQVIARDVKIQVDFNPRTVRSYRLLGYENRDVDDDKFRDDKEDGGEIGSGHQVTAMYEVKFHKYQKSDKIATVYIRHKDPETDEVNEIAGEILKSDFNKRFNKCSSDFKLAACAAEFAEILGKSYWAKDSKLDDVYNEVRRIRRDFDTSEVSEFLELINKTENLEEERADK